MTSSTVCVDSNIVLNLHLEQSWSLLADQLWQYWLVQNVQLVAPPLFRYEVTSVLRFNVRQSVITFEEGREALQEILALPIDYIDLPELHTRAYELVTQLNLPTAYGAHYLVVAQTLDCELWTADRRLVNAVSATFPWVKWLGHYSPPAPSDEESTTT